jgi:hypothetical protein
MLECLAHISLAGVTVLAWLGLGSFLLTPLGSTGDRLLDMLNRIGAGALAFALATFAVGWAGLLSSAAYLSVFALAAVAGAAVLLPAVRGTRLPRLRTWPAWQLGLAALLAVYAVLGAIATCAPISSPDALLYHAGDPALFEGHGRIVEIPSNSSSYEPFTVEMLVLDGFLLWNSVQGAFAPFLLALVALAAVAGAADRLAGRSAALLAGAIFFAQPFMTWEATSVFIEPGLASAVALASWNAALFIQHRNRAGLVLAGVFTGGAAGMKYLGLIAALALVSVAATLAWRQVTIKRALAFAVPAIVVALPWYVKNAVLTGNPFYPHVFGGLNPTAAAELEAAMRTFGHGRSPLDFLLLPVRLLSDGGAFDGGEFISPLFLAFAPLPFVLWRRGRLAVGTVWAGVLIFVIAWFLTTQQARFLVPLMPALAVLASLGALTLAQRGRLGRTIAVGVTSLALGGGLGAASVYAAQFAPVVVGTQSKQDFLRSKVSFYAGVEWLNVRLGPDDKVLVDFWSLLYLEVPHITFGTMGDLLPHDAGREATRSFVEMNDVTHVAILASNTTRRRQVEHLDARLLERVPVRSVRSRTWGDLGPKQDLLVYAVEGAR